MLRIAALNEELSEESSGPDEPLVPIKEVEEADALNLYKEALELRRKNDLESALSLFHQILALPCIENAILEEKEANSTDVVVLSSCLQIKYACLKNIGALHVVKGSLDDALEAYLEAVEVDSLDVTVWYNIGKLSMSLKNFQLARHAFLQGLACSPNHWPCLDGVISVLFGLGDDVVCLNYINKAIEKDPFYTRGLILRDKIFQDIPSLKEDIKQISGGAWTHLFETYPYDEEEKKECLEEALKLREDVGGQYKEIVLPTVPLSRKIESLSWVAVGQSLLETYRTISTDLSSSKMSCLIDVESPSEKTYEETKETFVSPAAATSPSVGEVVEMMDCNDDAPLAEAISSAEDRITSVQVDEPSEVVEQSRKNSSSEEIEKCETEIIPETPAKAEPPVKLDNRKRKRSLEQTTPASDREIQRRSTRSRAYAQQVEEDIYSLRAELRSFLPTSLLLEDNTDATSSKTDEITNTEELEIKKFNSIPQNEEESSVTAFLEEVRSSKVTIIDLLCRFCINVSKFDGFRWTDELSHLFKEIYHIIRSKFNAYDLYDHLDGDDAGSKGFTTLIQAEIFISSHKVDPNVVVPSWFTEDLTFLFQCADPIDTYSTHSQDFQIRVLWLLCNWHFQNGRVEVASSFLQMANHCFYSLINKRAVENLQEHHVIIPRTVEKPVALTSRVLLEMDGIITQTMQLEDVVKLHQEKQYKQLVSILKSTFADSNSKTSNRKYRVPVDRPTQLGMLLDGLFAIEDFDEYLKWSEQSLDESTNQYLAAYNRKNVEETVAPDQPSSNQLITDWSKVIERIAIDIEEILRFKRTALNTLCRRALIRLAENLVLICSHQLEATDVASKMPLCFPIFWVLLHRVIEFEENRLAHTKRQEHVGIAQGTEHNDSDEDVDEPLPCSILFLISAHDLLGKHSWCMLHDGIFVLHLLEVLMRRRRVTHDAEDREELGRAIEQASFCALGYPTSKKTKSRSLTDHCVTSVAMTWNRVLLLAEFFLPSRQELPEFDTVKPTSNAEQEMLLQKVTSLIPSELDPRNRLDDIQSFIQGRQADIPAYMNHSCVPSEVENVYYLLADYYFKNKEWVKAIENYILDLALVPDRFDSWAAVALAIASRLETKLNSCERLKNLASFLDRAEAALRCFRRALCLRPLQTTLWIEQGSTAYMLHSFCSQLLRNETDSLSIEMFERLEKEKERMLDIAQDCFVAADKASLKGSGDDQDERWLHHYMLGKIAEKRSKPFSELIEHYQRAAQLLEESSAAYPKKISYNTPPQLSVEALEIHYRIHSNCLKALMSLEDRAKDIPLFRNISKQLEKVSNGAFARGGRRVSVEQKEEVADKTTKKRKASKHEEDKPNKKTLIDSSEVPEVKLEGRAATIHDVTIIINEILERVVLAAKPTSTVPLNEEVIVKAEATPESTTKNPEAESEGEKLEVDTVQSIKEIPIQSSTCTSSSDSSSSDSDDDSSSSSDSDESPQEVVPSKTEEEKKIESEPIEVESMPVPDLQEMVTVCIGAIKECVGRFPHFYKGLYRLAHYYYHSKVNHNIDACRELLLGRPISASIVQLQQQQGLVQVRFLPTGVAGLFTEWRSNNFFHGIWRIPINEIDRPGCFAAHMGRSAALLLDVLRETRDHRILMELALALQPEPEPDKKYLFDSEREQHASLALSLMVQVLRGRLQEIKDASVMSAGEDIHHSSPQQGSPSSSKKLSLLMDTFRAYDRIERNLPGQEAVFGALLMDGFKLYRGFKDSNETDANVMEQALTFCRNKQAQSRARVGGGRGGLASSLGVVSTRGKRPYTSRRGKSTPAVNIRAASVKDHSSIGTLPVQPQAGGSAGQNSANVMQEAMKLLQSAGGSINNLPQHLKNIPGISNLLALFSNPSGEKKASTSSEVPLPTSSPSRPGPKKEVPVPKPVAPVAPAVATPASVPQAATISSNPLLQSLPGVSGASSSTASTLASLGMMDPSMLAMLSNPYFNPLSMYGSAPMTSADASSISKMQQEYQQQMMNWMQSALAQSYVMSNFNPTYFANQKSRGRGTRKSSSNRPVGRTSSTPKAQSMSNVPNETVNVSASTSARTPTPDANAVQRHKTSDLMKRTDSTESSKSTASLARSDTRGPSAPKLLNDLKLPPPLFDSSMMRPSSSHQDAGVKNRPIPPSTATPSLEKKKSHLPSSSSAHSSGKQHKRAITTPTIDVSKLIAGFSPGFDLERLSQIDLKAIENSLARGKQPKLPGESQSTSLASKMPPSGKSMGAKDLTAAQMPINLGRDITVTATTSSSKPIVSQSMFPGSSMGSNKNRQTHFSSSSHNPANFASLGLASQLFPLSATSGRQSDPHNIAFSVLQNLPSSMSLLVKPSSSTATNTKHSGKSQTGPIDLAVNKPSHSSQQPSNQFPSLPKLTPAPRPQTSKKYKQGSSSQTALPGSKSSAAPSFLPNVSASQLEALRHFAKQTSNREKGPEKDRDGDEPDVVILD